MIDKGTLLRVKTKTKAAENPFGDCLYEVDQVSLEIRDSADPKRTRKDGVRCVMLGGTGPSARKGFVVIDTAEKIQKDIKDGTTEVVPASQREGILGFYKGGAKSGGGNSAGDVGQSHAGTGCVEVDI